MSAKARLITSLNKKEDKAIDFIESVLTIFNNYDEGVKIFGMAFNLKYEAEFKYLETDIINKDMNRVIDNPKHREEDPELTFKDLREVLKTMMTLKLEKRRSFVQQIVKNAGYIPRL